MIPVGGTSIFCRDHGGAGYHGRLPGDEFIGVGTFDLSYSFRVTHGVDDPQSFDVTFFSCDCPIEKEVTMEYCYWPGCAGDVDEDDDVDMADFLAVISAWGACEECPGDRTCDGEVDFLDLRIVLTDWTGCGD